MEYEEVARPTTPMGRPENALYRALAATATTGTAIRVPLNGGETHAVQNRLRLAMGHRRLLRYCLDGDALICWAVPREAANGQ